MYGKAYQGHKGGKRYNGGVSNSNQGYQGPQGKGYSNQENYNPAGGYGQRQDNFQSRPKDGYGGQKQYRKDDGYQRKDDGYQRKDDGYYRKDDGYARRDDQTYRKDDQRAPFRPETKNYDRPDHGNEGMKIQAQPFKPFDTRHEEEKFHVKAERRTEQQRTEPRMEQPRAETREQPRDSRQGFAVKPIASSAHLQ